MEGWAVWNAALWVEVTENNCSAKVTLKPECEGGEVEMRTG